MATNKNELMQQEGREKRTAKRLCVTSMTGLLLKCFLQSLLSLFVYWFFAKRSVWRKVKFGRNVF